MKIADFMALFTSIEPDSKGCLTWCKFINVQGYSQLYLEGKQESGHRVAYRIFKGPIPDGLQIDHLCRNRACVNPEHLEAVSQKVNILRSEARAAQNARKTHCNYGHELPEDRQCKICRQRRNAAIAAKGKPDNISRTHCRKGHPISGVTHYERRCRVCWLAAYEKRMGRPITPKRTACKNGHPYPEDVRMYKGRRLCRICTRAGNARARAKRKEAQKNVTSSDSSR